MQPFVYHLSHIDLDGYACQYLTGRCFKDIVCYNANYGPEVTAKLEQIVSRIEKDKTFDDTRERLILVTDLNLTTKEANWLEKEAMRIEAKIQLLDHHATGANAAERFAWYYLDTSKSATLITYEWLREHYGFDPEGTYEEIVAAVNAIDIWLNEDKHFEYGKVMLGMISGAREINRTLFPEEDRAFKLAMIDAARERIGEHEAPIVLDDELHQIKKRFFIRDKNDTKDNLVANYIAALLTADKERLTVTYKGYKGLLGYNVGSSSVIGNAFLTANPDYDFYMDVNQRGNFSLRSNDKVDVSVIAEEIGNGGGHPNSAGGKIEHFKDAFVYETFRDFIQEYLNEKAAQSASS
jgi:oligoribonuclease NrnB/cAMP/cGMP phosphodiesterase (DHH superfamily)